MDKIKIFFFNHKKRKLSKKNYEESVFLGTVQLRCSWGLKIRVLGGERISYPLHIVRGGTLKNILSKVTKIRDCRVKFSKKFTCGALVSSSTSHTMIFNVNICIFRLVCIKFWQLFTKIFLFLHKYSILPNHPILYWSKCNIIAQNRKGYYLYSIYLCCCTGLTCLV